MPVVTMAMLFSVRTNHSRNNPSVGISDCQRFHFTAGIFVPGSMGMLTMRFSAFARAIPKLPVVSGCVSIGFGDHPRQTINSGLPTLFGWLPLPTEGSFRVIRGILACL